MLARMHGCWQSAESGLDTRPARFPADAGQVSWERRRRAELFAADLATLGAPAAKAGPDGAEDDVALVGVRLLSPSDGR